MTEQSTWMDELLEPPLEHEERGQRFIDQIKELTVPGLVSAHLDNDEEEGMRRASEEVKQDEPGLSEFLRKVADRLSDKTKTTASVMYFEFPSQQLLDETKQQVNELACQWGGSLHVPKVSLKFQQKLEEADRKFQKDHGTFYSSLSTWSDVEAYDFY